MLCIVTLNVLSEYFLKVGAYLFQVDQKGIFFFISECSISFDI